MKCLRVKPNPSSLLWITICLGDLELKIEAVAVCTTPGSRELSRLEAADERPPGKKLVGVVVTGFHVEAEVCSRWIRAAS